MDKVELRSKLLHYFRLHGTGRCHAITARRLVRWLTDGKGDRAIRLVIRDLITEGYPIASSVHPPYGYYLVETPEEAEDYRVNLRARIREDALRLRDFKRASRSVRIPEQLQLV